MKKSETDMIDGFAATTDIILDATENVPVAGKVVSLWKVGKTVRDALFERKFTAFWKEFQKPEIDKVLLAQTFSNFRKEYTEDYFNEALFNAIEKSDSVLRTKMISRLLVLCSTGEIPRAQFWEVLLALQSLIISDLQKLPRLLFVQRDIEIAMKKVQVHSKATSEMNAVRDAVYNRLESVGLVSRLTLRVQGAGQYGRYKLDDSLTSYVCKCQNLEIK